MNDSRNTREGARGTGHGAGGVWKSHAPRPTPLVPVLAALCLAGGPRVSTETANRILAIVNDDVITEADVTSQVNALLEGRRGADPAEADPAAMHEAVLERLIEQRLMLQEAKREGIIVASDEILQRLNELKGRFASEEEFQQSLVDANLSQEQLKEKVRDQLMTQRIIDAKVRSTINVSPQDVAQAIMVHPELAKSGDRVRASHILVRITADRPEEKAKALSEDIRRQLVGGAEFSTLAKRHSEDAHREEGGEMGWVAQGELLPELDAALFSLKVGELSEPIRTQLGFHLVKVEERRSAASLSLMEANRAVYQRIYQKKFQDAFVRWLAEVKRRAYIDILSKS